MRGCSRGARAGAAILGSAVLLYALPASAVNWIMLQGTEPATAPAYRPFGFIGIEYQQTDGSRIAAGPFKGQPLMPNQIVPRLEDTSELQISHVRLGLQGRLFAGKLNYRISPLAGDNGISQNGSPNVKFTDLSVTLNLIPHARIRIGQFKQPGSEEGLQPAVLRDYIRPTNLSRQLTNERLFDSDGTLKHDANVFDGPLSGWRDTGIQVFDAFKTGPWEHTYALMAGTGSGLAIYNGSGDGRPDWYLYWSSELIFGGKGASRDGLKLTGWYQDGERELRIGAEQKTETFDRKRYGLGTVFRRGPWRVAGEWVKADGMIFNGTDGGAVPGSAGNQGNVIAGFNVLPDNEADGWYLDGGYRLFDKWELRARYDRLNRGTNKKETERRFETFTLGITYRPTKQVRVLADYEFRQVDAPGLPGAAVPSRILSEVDDVFGAKVWVRF
ncbi:porin [Candidatus Thiosymbion oneisti]|uniref:porin n=1 Tax=Candidatus Thiosymbion oneisti TaxID=589554 RepID=UPI000B7EA556|nr:porin [Candidatus Thiosymbion oneisti]